MARREDVATAALRVALAELLTERDVRPRPRVVARDVDALRGPGAVRCEGPALRRRAVR